MTSAGHELVRVRIVHNPYEKRVAAGYPKRTIPRLGTPMSRPKALAMAFFPRDQAIAKLRLTLPPGYESHLVVLRVIREIILPGCNLRVVCSHYPVRRRALM
jgi:hypothetical protein